MTRLEWGTPPRHYTHGVDQGVLYLRGEVIPWNGLISVNENVVGENNTNVYFDGDRSRVAQETGVYSATISAFTYPDELEFYLGLDDYSYSRTPKMFNFSYRTGSGDDHQIHLVYNACLTPASHAHTSASDSPSADLFTWNVSTIPKAVPWSKPGTHLMIDTNLVRYSEPLQTLVDALYGTIETEPRLPSILEIEDLFEDYTVLRIRYNGDGTWSATGPDDMIRMVDDITFEIVTESALYIEKDIYVIESY